MLDELDFNAIAGRKCAAGGKIWLKSACGEVRKGGGPDAGEKGALDLRDLDDQRGE
jgi:hypothetical protein